MNGNAPRPRTAQRQQPHPGDGGNELFNVRQALILMIAVATGLMVGGRAGLSQGLLAGGGTLMLLHQLVGK